MGDTQSAISRLGKVAVVMGGWSAERDVSLMSGQQVFDALASQGVDAHAIDAGRDIGQILVEGRFARAFLILHGLGGEDGTVQAALDLAGVPYTGSGVLGSALSMDKWRAKAICAQAGIPTPPARIVIDRASAHAAAKEIGLPVVIKPVGQGSSLGVTMVDTTEALDEAFDTAQVYGDVMLEQRIVGREVTIGIVGQRTLPPVALRAASGFYDYHAKYVADDTEYVCPAPLPEGVAQQLDALSQQAFRVLGCSGWGRVDFMLNEADEPFFIECNTAPGMTSHSLVPIAGKAAGLDFPALCLAILQNTLDADHRESHGGVAA